MQRQSGPRKSPHREVDRVGESSGNVGIAPSSRRGQPTPSLASSRVARRMERSRYIAIEGPIGAGKSALASLLAERFGGRRLAEPTDENPFLASFYEDRRKHAFQTQLFFLLSRFQQQQELFQQDLFSQVTIAD